MNANRLVVHNHYYPQGHTGNGAPPGWTQYVDDGPGAAGGPYDRRHPTSRATSAYRGATNQPSGVQALASGPATRSAVQGGQMTNVAVSLSQEGVLARTADARPRHGY